MNICKSILLTMCVTTMLEATRTNTYAVSFVNHTDSDYVIYKRPRPIKGQAGAVFSTDEADWKAILVVLAKETGYKDVLLRDPEGFGMQLKLEPQTKDSTYMTLYLKGGIKMSGDCVQSWWEGPYSIEIANDEANIVDSLKDYGAVKRIRYCIFHDAELVVHIYPDGMQLEVEHNAKELDKEKVTFASKTKETK